MMSIIINKKRITLSLPRDASDEEVIDAIAKAMGVNKEQVPILDKAESMAQINMQRNEVESIKEAYLSVLNSLPKVQASKYEELDDVARFIYAANHTSPNTSQFRLNIPSEPEKYPDFRLLFDNKKIGLE